MEKGHTLDYFGNEVQSLKGKKLFLFDMDGTIYQDDNLFPGTLQLLSTIVALGGRYVFITNNSSKSVCVYIDKLSCLGIKVNEDNFFTSTQATILYVRKNYSEALVYAQGTKSFIKELRDADIEVTEEVKDSVDVVVVGFDTELTSEKLRRTCQLLSRGIPFLATNEDLACPVSFGFVPDCGSICGMLKNATGRVPTYLGKPNPVMVDFVADKFHIPREEVCVIGDRLYTDIATGINAGVDTVCVLTGEATPESIRSGEYKPTYTFQSVYELYEVLKK